MLTGRSKALQRKDNNRKKVLMYILFRKESNVNFQDTDNIPFYLVANANK